MIEKHTMPSAAPPVRHNLPSEVAGFIGRAPQIAEITRLLAQTRLLTLAGAGGCGKTRLAIRVAGGLLSSYPDGVWFVSLAPLTDPALVPRAVAAALGIRGTVGHSLLATLATVLVSRKLLLILDNCEHLVEACARLAETLLGACPRLQILATSREPLRISGEIIWRVPALALPAPGPLPALEVLARVEAVSLFLDRARARQPDFTLTGENAPSVAAICGRLEGSPLGIELAAARMGALAPEQLAVRLDDALRLLGGGSRLVPRQETLRATLDWSYALLSEEEQTLLCRLAVFAGGFGTEGAEQVGGGAPIAPDEVVILLTTLVEKSLVEPRIQSQEAHYRLLEPVRQYAHERLVARDEEAGARRRHAHYVLELAETAEPHLMSGGRGPWLERLAAVQDNLRAALAWSRDAAEPADRTVGLRLAGLLCWFWNLRGEVSEGLEWLEAALAAAPEADAAIRAKALYVAGELAWMAGRNQTARIYAEESATLFRALGDKRWLAYTLQSLPMVMDHPGARASAAESLRLFAEVGDPWGHALAMFALDFTTLIREGDPTGEGQKRLEDSLPRWRELGDDWGTAQILNILGDLARGRDDIATATARYEEALALLRRQGLAGTVPSLLHNLGYLAVRRGETRRALRLFRESLALFRDQGDRRGIADCLAGLAATLAAMKQAERVARLLGAAEALREATGASVWPANAADYDRCLRLIHDQLGEQACTAAWAAGRALSPEQAIAEALAEPSGGRHGNDALDLTAREREVAALVAQGLTNRQIGAALFITEGTARLHVKHILRNLGFTSRAQIAAWAVERGLAAAPETD